MAKLQAMPTCNKQVGSTQIKDEDVEIAQRAGAFVLSCRELQPSPNKQKKVEQTVDPVLDDVARFPVWP